jgi:hypothetical protein
VRTLSLCFVIGVLLFATASCKKSIEYGDVCHGLLQTGTADSTKLLKPGDWMFKYFAYTPNGKDIIYKDPLPYGLLRATDTSTLVFYYHNEIEFYPHLTGTNNIDLIGGKMTLIYSLKEIPIEYVFWNTICYTIKDDILYIHYKEQDGKNLFILQRK